MGGEERGEERDREREGGRYRYIWRDNMCVFLGGKINIERDKEGEMKGDVDIDGGWREARIFLAQDALISL